MLTGRGLERLLTKLVPCGTKLKHHSNLGDQKLSQVSEQTPEPPRSPRSGVSEPPVGDMRLWGLRPTRVENGTDSRRPVREPGCHAEA
ncbi:Hypothetical predicted protein [Pelobates cultripes]|uniref:Uncharacterized protein n=1 Tax=Pelobates cultripes TaxID=61616 RepID=A0AAD1RGP5_PELCU|nr:Hypothetical predicted protein [Pelobates cultripes]